MTPYVPKPRADQRFLAQSGRTVLRGDHEETHSPWHLHQRRRSRSAIEDYLLRHNANPRPFVWTKPAKLILEQERRALDLLDHIKNGYQATESEH